MKDYRRWKMRLCFAWLDSLGSIFFHAKNQPISGISKIVILKFDRLGDSFMSLPVVSGLRANFPQAEIVVLAASWNREVWENNPAIDRLLVVDNLPDVHGSLRNFFSFSALSSLKKIIKAEKADLGIDLQGNPLNVLALYAARVKYRLGFKPKALSFLLTHQANYQLDLLQEKIYLSLLSALHIAPVDLLPKLYPSAMEQARVENFLEELGSRKLVIFHLGAGRSYRVWPVERFASLARMILASGDYSIIVFGDDQEKSTVSRFFSLLNSDFNNRVVDISQQFNLREFYHLLSLSHSFIGNDSAPARLVGALGLPAVCIFNPWSGVQRFGVQGQKMKLVYHEAHQCQGQFCHLLPCPNMAAVSVDEVYSAWFKQIKL